MSNDDSQLLMQASQIAGNLRERMAEQSRRERHIADQLAALDQEQRRLRMAQQQFEEDCQDRDDALKHRENDFAQKLDDAQQLLAELQNREDEVARGQEQLKVARKRLAEELAQQLDVDRAEALADRRGERRLQRHAVAVDGVEGGGGQQFALLLVGAQAGFDEVIGEADLQRIEHLQGGVHDFRADAVATDHRDGLGHKCLFFQEVMAAGRPPKAQYYARSS